MKNEKKAFTIIELIVVMAIIGILSTAGMVAYAYLPDKAKETTVQQDFRAFSLAAEQLVRENSGFGNHSTLTTLCAEDGGINKYLDEDLQFTTTGECLKKDKWNNKYTIQLSASSGTNNGAVLFLSGGKDMSLNGEKDYVIATTWCDGIISTASSGFSENTKSVKINSIEAGNSTSCSFNSDKVATLKYKKAA